MRLDADPNVQICECAAQYSKSPSRLGMISRSCDPLPCSKLSDVSERTVFIVLFIDIS